MYTHLLQFLNHFRREELRVGNTLPSPLLPSLLSVTVGGGGGGTWPHHPPSGCNGGGDKRKLDRLCLLCHLRWRGRRWIMGGDRTSYSCKLTGVEACTLQLFQPLLPQFFPFVLTTHPTSHFSKWKKQLLACELSTCITLQVKTVPKTAHKKN